MKSFSAALYALALPALVVNEHLYTSQKVIPSGLKSDQLKQNHK